MNGIRIVSEENECRAVWEAAVPRRAIWDLWEVRCCFHRNFRRQLHFIVAEQNGAVCGLLPLSRIEESDSYGFFPGEVWKGKTWLEGNRIVSGDEETLRDMLERCPAPYELRYLLPPKNGQENGWATDEIGYLFHPPRYGYDLENYFGEFSRKSRKRLKRDLEFMEALGVRYRYNDTSDFSYLVDLNLSRFGEDSYFSDPRFTESLRDLMNLLRERGWLRLTTIIIQGRVAAVDLGGVYNGCYTLFGGGTNADFIGVAKLINTHHIRWACEEKLELVDFLCGDFAWKKIFHLSPRPLYLLSSRAEEEELQTVEEKTGSGAYVG